eukprot:CAMPEP_0170482738 /NCGR_PEP_ID=MMETSP0208-20121228/2620_1 /TAXON_ID=197538 /ORGANISM="Strombidium inclinatum, Strain S3" /LENGTH=128 /DNA_ID=CAMNT_0010755603 /DNA_START=888 /DNA_END=1274 /DNA_ORIENTATION=+
MTRQLAHSLILKLTLGVLLCWKEGGVLSRLQPRLRLIVRDFDELSSNICSRYISSRFTGSFSGGSGAFSIRILNHHLTRGLHDHVEQPDGLAPPPSLFSSFGVDEARPKLISRRPRVDNSSLIKQVID